MSKIAGFYAELGLIKDKFDKGMNEAGKSPAKLSKQFVAMGAAIGASLAVIGTAFVAISVKGMEAWDKQVKAEAGLLKALNDRKLVQQALIQQAGTLQRSTLFGDEATIEAQKMLAVMGLSATQIIDLIPLIQDFATVNKMDLASAANLVGKSLGTSRNALKLYGVEFDTTGNKAEKSAALISKFTEIYGGQAKKAAEVGTSGLEQLKNAWGDIMEIMGSKVGPFIGAISKILTGELMDAASGAAATGLQKTVNEYLAADEAGREGIKKGLEDSLTEYNRLWQEAKDKDDKVNREHYSLQADYVRESLAEIDKLNKESAGKFEMSADDIAAAEELKRKKWDETNKAIQEQNELAEINADTLRTSMASAIADMDAANEAIKTANEKWKAAMNERFEVEEEQNVDDGTDAIEEKFWKIRESTQSFITDMNAMTEAFIEDFIYGFSEGIAGLLTGDVGFDSFFNTILNSIGSFLKQMGAAVIAYGITISAFKKAFTNPIAAIAAGAALVIAGSVISNLASKGPSVGGGGGTAGMSGAGGGAAYSNNVSGYGNDNAGYVISTNVSGDDLRIIMQRAERNATRRV